MDDDRRNLERRLESIGAHEPAGLTAERARALEARVLATVAGDTARADQRRWAPILVMAAAATVLVVIALAFASGSGPSRFEVADGVVLELPGGAAVASAGDELPDGAIVDIGTGGVAVVDGNRFGPGRYRVADGRLVPVATTTTTTTTSVTPTPGGLAPPTRPAGSATTTVTAVTPIGTSPAPTRPTRTTIDRRTTTTTSSPPARTTTTAPARTTTTAPATTTTSTVVRDGVPATDAPTTTLTRDGGRDRRP